jgi:transcriptional regulator with XRE-family HTH domain
MDIEKLRTLRIIKRIPQGKLAKEVGTSQARMSLIENGLAEVRPDERVKFAKALGVPLREIWDE